MFSVALGTGDLLGGQALSLIFLMCIVSHTVPESVDDFWVRDIILVFPISNHCAKSSILQLSFSQKVGYHPV